jgi:hypothetical protein
MKCRFSIDVPVNPATMRDSERAKVKFRQVKMRGKVNGKTTVKNVPDPYFPAGTIYENDNAAFFVMQGMADPADDECAAACGMNADEIAVAKRALYKMEHILVKDWQLFDADVITGYDEKGEYIPGPKWAEWHAVQDEEEDDE